MLKNYIKIAWRNITKNKMVFLINVIGLSIGLTACLLMFIYIRSELSYDRFQNNGNRIARVIMDYSFGEERANKGNYTSARVLPVFRNEFPEIESGVRMTGQVMLVKNNDNIYEERDFVFVDSTFFNVFTGFKLIEGSAADVLNAANKVVLTKSAAIKYFGDLNVIGKTLKLGVAQTDYEITGISEDCPQNSQIKYEMLSSFQNLKNAREDTYWNANYITYLLLKQPGDLAALQSKINNFMKEEMKNDQNASIKYELEPFFDIHLQSPYPGLEANSNIKYIYITAGIAIMMLIIASFTYINLSTVRSIERAKEVGIRKVAGATKSQVFWQFMAESFIISCIAFFISLGLTMLIMPSFNALASVQISFMETLNPLTLITGVLIIITITLLAGIYPAMVLSNFLPVKILKGSYKNTSSGMLLRKGLTTFQFTISAFLICATIIMYQQLKYIQQKEMGYNKDQVLILPSDNTINQKLDVFKTELKKNSGILHVSATANAPYYIVGGYSVQRRRDLDEQIAVTATPIDEEYLQVNDIQLIAGEPLTRQDIAAVNVSDDKAFYSYIINESAAKKLGYSAQDAIGKPLIMNERNGQIKGVVKNFHFQSIHHEITPLVLFPDVWYNMLLVKVNPAHVDNTIAHMQKVWNEIAPHRPFKYSFVDEQFQKMYSSEQQTGKIILIFTSIAIALACLGLFGLSSYSIIVRTKEIGIRKVLGSSVNNIVAILSRDFIKMVLVASLIAIPLAWFAMQNWLSGFSYRITIHWWLFAIAAVVLILIAFLTIAMQSVKAALTNPVKSLRDE